MSKARSDSWSQNPWATNEHFSLCISSTVGDSVQYPAPSLLHFLCQQFLLHGKHRLKSYVRSVLKRESYDSLSWSLYTGLFGVDFVHFTLCNKQQPSLLISRKEALTTFFERNKNWSRKRLGYDSDSFAFLAYLSTNFFSLETLPFQSSLQLPKKLYESYSGQTCANELLYGRAGLVSLLNLLKTQFNCSLSLDTDRELILSSISLNEFPWMWHEKVYFGAAHGTAGILLVLFRYHIEDKITPSALSPEKFSLPIEQHTLWENLCNRMIEFLDLSVVIEPSDYLTNIASSQGSRSPGRLMQWCHGASGVLPLLYLVRSLLLKLAPSSETASSSPQLWGQCQFELYNRVNELLPLLLETVWQRGMLTMTTDRRNNAFDKGGGLCHGLVSGAYATLSAFLHFRLHPPDSDRLQNICQSLWRRTVAFVVQLFRRYGTDHTARIDTFSESYLPISFDRWNQLEGQNLSCDQYLDEIAERTLDNSCAQNDHPMSLFEGISGVLLFIHDFVLVWNELAVTEDETSFSQITRLRQISKNLVGGLKIF